MSAETTTAPAPVEVPTLVAGESTAGDTTPQAPAVEHIDGEEALGDPGKKALDAMKAKWREAEKKAAETEARIAAMQAKIDGKEAEHAAEQERRNVESAALAKANERILKAEIRAAAAGKLADPADALKFLDLAQFEVGPDGEVDAEAVASAIADVVKAKPYLAAQGGTPATVFESPAAHRDGAPKAQLTRADVEQMTPEQVNAARAEGRLNNLLGIKS